MPSFGRLVNFRGCGGVPPLDENLGSRARQDCEILSRSKSLGKLGYAELIERQARIRTEAYGGYKQTAVE